MPKIEVKRILTRDAFPGVKVKYPRCEEPVPPQKWNGMNPNCKSVGSIEINGKRYCHRHAGSVLLKLHLGEK